MPLVALDLVPQPRYWKALGSWRDNVFEVDPALDDRAPILTSPDFQLDADKLLTFCFSAYFGGEATFLLHIVECRRDKNVHTRLFKDVAGDTRMSAAFRAGKAGKYRFVLEHVSHPKRGRITIAAPKFLARGIGDGPVVRGRVADFGEARKDSEDGRYPPHWNRLQRYIHRRCSASRRFNNYVSAIEMRLERQELLSLPQYMGLCPTGQCNATCDFCSVTINRTGIIKEQVPYERLESFLAPVANTIQMFGIEGNGEPTLYTRFPELVERLTRGRAKAYLITNGSRLRLDDAPLLLALDAVNFSLNAATAETHQRVMKLKNFDEITALIRSLTRERGVQGLLNPEPAIYTTFVVTHDNVHEAVDFVRMAEQDFGVDVVLLRPLAELGNELGTVEDLRRIVPYESDVKDMIDAVQDYKREFSGKTAIGLLPETFRSSRPDPVGRVAMPRGFEGRLLAPRRDDWITLSPDVAIIWSLNSARIMLPAAKGALLRSQPIPVGPERELTFRAQVSVHGGPLRLTIVDSGDQIAADVLLADTGDRMIPLEVQVQTGQGTALSIVLAGEGRVSTVRIDFERLRTPAPYVSNEFHIPPGRRWEICTPGARVTWDAGTLALHSATGGRPYLIKSYAIPCARDTIVEIPAEIDVSTGEIEIGILDDSSGVYLKTFCFAKGRTAAVVFFNTGANDAVRLVVSAQPQRSVDATIVWGKPRIVIVDNSGEDRPLRLPSGPQWAACVPTVQIDRSEGRLSLAWRGTGSPYLLQSNKVRCRPGQQAKTPMIVEVREGRLGVGVLGVDGAAWLATRMLEEGTHRVELDFDTLLNDEVSFVLFAIDDASVVATIDVSDNSRENDLARASAIIGFEHPRTPTPYVEFRIPPGRRWENCAPDAEVDWDDSVVTLRSSTGGRPYLLKSAAIRCAQEVMVEVPVQVDVSAGAIEIGVINASGESYLQTFCFAEGRSASSVFFNTGVNDAVRLLVSASPDQTVEAMIRWGKPRVVLEEDGERDQIRIPGAPEWAVCVPAARVVDRSEDRLSVSWRGTGSPYLLKSNKARCRPDQQTKAPMVVEVSEGQLGIGVLGVDDAAWLTTQTLGEGKHHADLDFNTGANDEVSFVLFAVDGASVVASVGLSENGLATGFAPARAPQDELAAIEPGLRNDLIERPSAIATPENGLVPDQAEIAVTAAVESSARQLVADIPLERATFASVPPAIVGETGAKDEGTPQPDRLFRQVRKWARGGVRYYCQKPWTDMNNFTVDGRMDVCCIATGASQEAYQLGNLNSQSFQEIWNGPMARKFRRTVNSDNKMPPCARCPMSHAYQGFLFNPDYTYRRTILRVVNRLNSRGLSWPARWLDKIGGYFIKQFLFSGFKR